MPNYKLYVLKCPKLGIVRYVGITRTSLERRFKNHLVESNKTLKCNWIKSLKREKLYPAIILLTENLTKDEAEKLEIETISLFRFLVGEKLLNMHEGGNIPPVCKFVSKETRKKLSESKKKLFQERPELNPFLNKNPMHNKEIKDRMIASRQANLTDEVRKRRSEAAKLHWIKRKQTN